MALDRLERGLAALIDWAAAHPWRRGALAVALALAVSLPGLSALPVTDRDEARFAQASKQMIETGDLIDIRFQDAPRWKKPVGIYWMQAASASAFGGADAPIWAYRLPSVLGLIVAVLAAGWAAAALIGPRAAALAGPMLAVTVLAAAEAHIAKTDSMLLGLCTLCFAALAQVFRQQRAPLDPSRIAGDEPRGDRKSLSLATVLAFWGAMAGAVLVKGPILPAIVIFALLWLWVWLRQTPPVGRLRPLLGFALVIVLVAPWLVAIWQVSDGGFFRDSLGKDLMGKLAEGKEKHWGPPGLYLAIVWGTFWPWAALLPFALPWLWRQRRATWMALLAGWVIPFWLVLEAAPTKLPHYVLPLYPALILGVLAWALAEDRPVPRPWQCKVSAGLAALPPVALALAALVLPLALEGRLVWAALPFAALAVFAGIGAARAALALRPLAQIAASLVAALALYPAVLQFGLPALDTAFPSARMAVAAAQWRPCASGPIYSIGYREPSLVFLTETGTKLAQPKQAVEALRHDPGAMVLVESRWREHLDKAMGAAPPALVERAAIAYFNYNRGKRETAVLLTGDTPRWCACAE